MLEEKIGQQEELVEEIEKEVAKGNDADEQTIQQKREEADQIADQINQALDSEESGTTNDNIIAIQHQGKNYKHADTIKIPFDRNLEKQLFKIIGIDKNAKVDWAFYSNLDTEAAYASLGDGKEIEVDVIKNYTENLILGAEYWKSEDDFPDEKSKEIRVFIKVFREPFELIELTATHKDKPKRIAKSGETLYLINPPSATNTKKDVVYNVEIDPESVSKQYSKSDIQWFYNKPGTTSNIPKNGGEKSILRTLVESKEIDTTIVKAGYPTTAEKAVEVEWVDKNKETYKVIPPAIQNTIKTVFNNMNRLNKITKKLGKYRIKLEPKIEFFGTEFNEEDETSRYYNLVRDGGVNASVDLKYKVPLPPPYSIDLTIPWIDYSIGEIGAYIDLSTSLKVSGIIRYQKRSDKKSFEKINNTIAVKGEGGLEFGAKVNVLPEIKSVKIDIKAYGKTRLSASGKLNITSGNEFNFKPEIYLEPLIGGYSGEIKTEEYIIFKTLLKNSYLKESKYIHRIMKKEDRKVLISLLIFIMLVPAIIFFINGMKSLSIFLNSSSYKIGTIIIEKYDCGNSYGGDDSNCYGFGTINGKDYRLNLGLAPDSHSLFNDDNYADLSKTNYSVYYIENRKNVILRKKGQIELNSTKYLFRSILELILPLVVLPTLIYFYRK